MPANDNHDWVNLTDGSFDDLLPVCDSGSTHQIGQTVATDHALGAKTNCDAYVYSFSYDDLASRISDLIDAYDSALARVQSAPAKSRQAIIDQITENTQHSLRAIKWTHTLKQSLKSGEEIEFDKSRIREVLYRPFTKLWLYEDHRILSQAKATSDLFPQPDVEAGGGGGGGGGGGIRLRGIAQQPGGLRNDRDRLPRRPVRSRHEPASTSHPTEAIMISSSSNMIFQALATDTMPDIAAIKGSQQTRVMPRLKQS